MRHFLLASSILLAASSAMAQAPLTTMSRPVAAMARGCSADFLSGAGPAAGSSAYTARICQIRCDAGARFNAANIQPPAASRRGRTAQQVARAAVPPPAAVPTSVIFVGRAPSRGFGLIVGDNDRLQAFREAEDQCRVEGAGCRMLMEAPASCGAVAHVTRRSEHALMITSNPSTWTVIAMSGGFGANLAAAEADAMADCRSRDTGATCLMVASRCGGSSRS